MKSIVIPTDFSPSSRYATLVVLELIKETENFCRVLLLNTFMVQHTDPDQVIRLNDELKQLSKQGLECECEAARRLVTNSNITVEVASHMGSLSNVLLHLLNKEKIDLVVLDQNGGWQMEELAGLLKQKKCQLLVTSST